MKKLLLLCGRVLVLGFSSWACAGVYQCAKTDGSLEFRDTPCHEPTDVQAMVPIPAFTVEEKHIQKQAKERASLARNLKKTEQKRVRSQQKRSKQVAKMNEQRARRKNRSVRLQEKIDHLERQLRSGCKIKKSNRIREEIEQAQRAQQRVSRES